MAEHDQAQTIGSLMYRICQAVFHMSVSETDQQIKLLKSKREDVENGVISADTVLSEVMDQTLSCLNDATSPSSVLEAVAQLLVVLFSDDSVKTVIENKPTPLIDSLFFILKNNTASTVRQNIFKAIGNLTSKNGKRNAVKFDAQHDPVPRQTWLVSKYDAISVIVDTLAQHPDQPELLACGFYALQKIAYRQETNIRWLFTHSVHELALSSIATHVKHIHLQTQACALLRRLSFLDETRSVLMTTACKSILCAMRAFVSEPELQEHCCVFIHNVGIDPNVKKMLVSEPYLAHQDVLTALRTHPHDVSVQVEGCATIWCLVVDPDTKKMLVAEPHLAHTVVLKTMLIHAQTACVLEQACAALKSMAVDVDNKRLLVQEPHFAHQAILSAMHKHPQAVAVQEEACAALWNLSVDHDNKVLLVSEPHCAHQAILKAMLEHSLVAGVQEKACGALWTLAVNAENRKVLVSESCRAHLVVRTAMINHSQNAELQENACGALSNLAVDEGNQKLLTECGAHLAIIAAMRAHSHQEQVQLEAVWALFNLSFETMNRTIFKQLEILELCQKAHRTFPNNTQLLQRLEILENNLT